MGGAKFMGRDKGTPYSKELDALQIFTLWLIGGLPISFLISILISSEINLSVPIIFYIIISVILFVRYIKMEGRSKE